MRQTAFQTFCRQFPTLYKRNSRNQLAATVKKAVCWSTIENTRAASEHKGRYSRKDQKNNQDCHRSDNKNMARTKATVRRLPAKTRCLPKWLVNREYGKKKNNLPFQDKRNTTRTKDCNHHQEWTNKKINVKRKSRYFNSTNRLIF